LECTNYTIWTFKRVHFYGILAISGRLNSTTELPSEIQTAINPPDSAWVKGRFRSVKIPRWQIELVRAYNVSH
jgi:hypothetical protein